ncbi:MAG TPA: hypothetical protein VFI28_05730, partial [Candidatus Limnocylindrales bacterium]|nr:hypothetical protein [Candidatus Limnocylindrales bacterium]
IVDDCTGLAGTVAGVGVVTGTVVETAQGFHLQTASNFVLTFEFVDGSSGTGTLVEHQSFNTGRGATVFTNAHLDTLTLFAPDGSLLVDASFRLVEHFTIGRDGSVRASFEIGHFRGDC